MLEEQSSTQLRMDGSPQDAAYGVSLTPVHVFGLGKASNAHLRGCLPAVFARTETVCPEMLRHAVRTARG
eukprot:SAG11_NODE_426_length_9563_cov_7.501479_8_plen_70_part_00